MFELETVVPRSSDPSGELQAYLTEPVHIRNPLLWWANYAARFPKLAILARKYLCVMGTSVPSERVFSAAGLAVSKSRASLDSDTVDMLIFMNKCLRAKLTHTTTEVTTPLSQPTDGPGPSGSQLMIKQEDTPCENNNDEEPPLPALY